jgi:hypothetical protein
MCVYRRVSRAGATGFWGFAILLSLTQGDAFADNPLHASYPERGTVVSVQVKETVDYAPIMPVDSKGRAHGGEAFTHHKQVYHVETNDGPFDLQGGKHADFAVNDAVEFRVEKDTAHVRAGAKEKKYRILSTSAGAAK